MYLILCWSYFNHSLHLVGKKKNKIKKRILNRNRNIGGINHNSIIFPNRSALVHTVCEYVLVCVCLCVHVCVCLCVCVANCAVAERCWSRICVCVCVRVCVCVCVSVCVCCYLCGGCAILGYNMCLCVCGCVCVCVCV